jgi:ADP-ribose pyrophosphatase YjhB (NUDIX family)
MRRKNIHDRGRKAVACRTATCTITTRPLPLSFSKPGAGSCSAENDPAWVLDLPGGFADYGESFESALRREIREETGMDLGELTYFGSFPNTYAYLGVTYFTADAVFIAALPEGGPSRLSDEIREMVLVRPESVNFEDMAFDVTKRVLKAYWKIPGGEEGIVTSCGFRELRVEKE